MQIILEIIVSKHFVFVISHRSFLSFKAIAIIIFFYQSLKTMFVLQNYLQNIKKNIHIAPKDYLEEHSLFLCVHLQYYSHFIVFCFGVRLNLMAVSIFLHSAFFIPSIFSMLAISQWMYIVQSTAINFEFYYTNTVWKHSKTSTIIIFKDDCTEI